MFTSRNRRGSYYTTLSQIYEYGLAIHSRPRWISYLYGHDVIGTSGTRTMRDFVGHVLETRPTADRITSDERFEWVGAGQNCQKLSQNQNTNRAFENTRFGGTTRTECGVNGGRAPGVRSVGPTAVHHGGQREKKIIWGTAEETKALKIVRHSTSLSSLVVIPDGRPRTPR